jgi:hypothetical protein
VGALCCAAFLAWIPGAEAQHPIPATTKVEEQLHTVEVELERSGATLQFTRSIFNPGMFHARVDLPVTLPCDTILDGLEVEELGPDGSPRWRPAELIDPEIGSQRFEAHYAGPDDLTIKPALDSDTAVLMSRDTWGCDAELSIYPIPPLARRTVRYRVFVPGRYDHGRTTIDLPSFDDYGLIPTLELAPFSDRSVVVTVDGSELDGGAQLSGARSHAIELEPRDTGLGRVRAVDLDVEALIAASPAAQAKLSPDAGAHPRVLEIDFEAPAELAKLPPVRRAVIVLDASRSLSASEREQLQRFGAAYFEALPADARVEVVLFDRKVRRVYHEFVPAAWGAVDLPKLDIADGNGSELGKAVAYARELLAEPSAVEGADWILVLSDLALRSDFDVAAEQAAAAAGRARMHVVRRVGNEQFFPADDGDPWTALARTTGGMAWVAGRDGSSFADELVSPRRIWELELELEFADGQHRNDYLGRWHEAGRLIEWFDYEHQGAALSQAALVGRVWGQRRAWTATPSELGGRRSAAALATDDPYRVLSEAARTALAYYAGVISPFTSAWALAGFDGAAPGPLSVSGVGSLYGSSHGYTTRCGGAAARVAKSPPTPMSFAELAQQALDHCKITGDGHYAFETTDNEIVAVTGSKRCITEQTWATDISPALARGRKRVSVEYVGGNVIAAPAVAL